MVNMIIDGKNVSAPKGSMLLEAIRGAGISVPTLCAHEAVSRSGACRLCVVEIKKGNRTRIVTSCLYGVEEGLTVNTKSDRVLNVRRLVMELLLARCPESDLLQKMAKDMAVEPQARYAVDTDKGKCILCRSCVRVCEEVVGVSAIGLFSRGSYKEVGTPYNEKSDVCIGCGACVYVCPTGHIEMTSTGDKRKIWGRTFKMQACEKCGKFFAPVDQLKFISKKTGVPFKELTTCTECR
ncbi:MAG: NADP-reducing hydrogenase subunit HndC [Deltaproteobacteria bacterium ADurb.Bin151]|nr:MAG: NADP-reducing hydrogenase subunit HndC [Deltaproteobacteria bacterium ADurb.Bin151]HNZ11826.1 2Fe-2S iron-sulfur cluster-binding protein [Smithellaceae bacterium]HOG82595.1 2Fe-2S iron-sulfur cluster-binding protein [Smithellaceae bacterium]HOQ42135.1 2Fe-2S iron-sulfur cluster-binding protein [Smithellaceae bacterium]HPL66666.1 2Fe-2S iron-sulfur cluster-binding protein [Smithellaceae bacterium]